jgi:hypothetical protein
MKENVDKSASHRDVTITWKELIRLGKTQTDFELEKRKKDQESFFSY